MSDSQNVNPKPLRKEPERKYKHSDFWGSLLSAYVTPMFIASGEGLCFDHPRMQAILPKHGRIFCACRICCRELNLEEAEWTNPKTGLKYTLIVPRFMTKGVEGTPPKADPQTGS